MIAFRLPARIAAITAALFCADPALAEDDMSRQAIDAYSIGVQAYIYGFPMIAAERARLGMTAVTEVDGVSGKAPQGIWGHGTQLAGPEMKDIQSTNNDTVYSWIWLDLEAEPYIFVKPETGERFYTTQFVDAFTNNFAYISTRTDGPAEKTVALVGPGWSGALPTGIERIEAPTDQVFVILRYGVSGDEDMPNIAALQAQSALKPLSHWRAGTEPEAGPPSQPPDYDGPLAAFEWIGDLLAENRPPANEAGLIGTFARIGLSPDHGFDASGLSEAEKAALGRAAEDGLAVIEAAVTDIGREVNGWQLPPVSDEFFGNDYMLRAVIGWQSVFQNTPAEAYYPALFNDADGVPLDGAEGRYVLRFEGDNLPPVDAFWSITLYDLENRLMVENEIKRYSIGDRTPGLVYDEDGSLEIMIQAEDPGGDASANWLPAPSAPFYLLMRAYLPQQAMLDGSYALPPVRTR